jgi:hypothetical protein
MLAVFERIDLGVVEGLLAAASGEASLSFIEFANQFVRQSGSVPDASISSRFRYLFEVKSARNAVRLDQLREHLRYLDGTFSDERLFVLTPDGSEPTAVSALDDRRVLWFNFVSLSQAINGLIEDPGQPFA